MVQTESLNCLAQDMQHCVCVQETELVFLACDFEFWAVLCHSTLYETGCVHS